MGVTVDIDKMKALALRAQSDTWPFYEHAFRKEANPATVLELIAEVERLRARFEYIEEHATTKGGGHGFEVKFFVPVDCEDIGCGIDAAIASSRAQRTNKEQE